MSMKAALTTAKQMAEDCGHWYDIIGTGVYRAIKVKGSCQPHLRAHEG
jgi:hypothetical protein